MTPLVNVAAEGSQVGVQAGHVYIGTVTLPGGLTVGEDASPEAKYRTGVENLKSGNPGRARELIWDAMMSNHVNSEVLFHWLVAMLSGRTMRQFSPEEIDQLRQSRSRCARIGDDEWADGVRLIYRLLDTVPPFAGGEPEREMAKTDMSVLVKQFEILGEQQRDMIRPRLELFLTGPRQDEMWRRELEIAQSVRYSRGRAGRAWMFFQPIPARACLPPPQPESIRAADRLALRACTCLLAAVTGYLGWVLLWHGALLGLLAGTAAIAGGAVVATAELRRRFLARRRAHKDQQFSMASRASSSLGDEELTGRVDQLFDRYFTKYAEDQDERRRWTSAVAGFRRFHADEIIEMCRTSGVSADELAWLIRYQVRQLKERWQKGTLYDYRQDIPRRAGAVASRWAGLAALISGGFWAAVAVRAHPLGEAAASLSAFGTWWYWRRVTLARRMHAAERDERASRQAAINEEFGRWSKRLEGRPSDAQMAAWLESDLTVLLGRALEHFQLRRSRLKAHAFLEEPAVGVKRARIKDGTWRYGAYRLQVVLLTEDGVRQMKAHLNFMTGTLTIRERTSYRYDAIVSVRVLTEARRRQMFELRLAAGDPITVRVRDPVPGETQDQDAAPQARRQEAAEDDEDNVPELTSMADLLHTLERVAGVGGKWFEDNARTSA